MPNAKLPLEDDKTRTDTEVNLGRLGPGERASIFDFELISRISFRANGKGEAILSCAIGPGGDAKSRVLHPPCKLHAVPPRRSFWINLASSNPTLICAPIVQQRSCHNWAFLTLSSDPSRFCTRSGHDGRWN